MPFLPPSLQCFSVEALKAAIYIHTYIQIYIAPKITRMNLRNKELKTIKAFAK